jgi:hypothetical protein
MDSKWEVIPMSLIMLIPVVAIVGGIISGIVKRLGQQRIIEMAQRERLAAIERGIDPAQLPPLPAFDEDPSLADPAAFERRQIRMTQGLMIGGIVTLVTGAGVSAFMAFFHTSEKAWTLGIVPIMVGLALLISAAAVRTVSRGRSPKP